MVKRSSNGNATTVKLKPEVKEALRRWMHEQYLDTYSDAIEELLKKVKAGKDLFN